MGGGMFGVVHIVIPIFVKRTLKMSVVKFWEVQTGV
jgi:hypothetical protein